MGEAKRRRLQRAIDHAFQQGGGVWDIQIIRADDMLPVLLAAASGHPYATQLAQGVARIIGQIGKHRSPRNAPLCRLCPAELWHDQPPRAVVVLHAHHDQPANAISAGICATCTERQGDRLSAAVVDAYREQFQDPTIRVIPPPSAPGHA